ncbi:MAG: transposase, partial [Halioglobus sp.]
MSVVVNNPQVNSRKANLNLKLHEPQRLQVEFHMGALDDLIGPDQKARIIWDCVQSMNTDPCFRHIKSALNGPGRKATNPEVLFALWLLAFTDDVVSRREIVKLTEEHDAYKWVRGGVPINHDLLCTFRSLDPSVFEDL